MVLGDGADDNDNDNDEDTQIELRARMDWLVHTIKLREGIDYTCAARDGEISLQGLEDKWRKTTEDSLAEEAALAKEKIAAKSAAAKGKTKDANETNPSKYSGVSHSLSDPMVMLLNFLKHKQITPGAVDNPMKGKSVRKPKCNILLALAIFFLTYYISTPRFLRSTQIVQHLFEALCGH